MIKRFLASSVAAVCLAYAVSASARMFAADVLVDQKWTANGATACEKFLTPEVLSAILVTPSGTAVKDDTTSCHKGAIYIILKVANVETFKQEMPRIAMTHAMTGVGDAAYWNQAGAISSVKAPDRGCDMSVIGAPTKVSDAALGQKLGEVCNALFALK